MLETPPDEPIVEIQRLDHESRVHRDIETDDIPAEVGRLEELGARVVDRLERWVVMQAPVGQRLCVVRIQRPEECQPLGLDFISFICELAPGPTAACKSEFVFLSTSQNADRSEAHDKHAQ